MLKLVSSNIHQDTEVTKVALNFSDAPEIEAEVRLPREIAVEILQAIADASGIPVNIPEYYLPTGAAGKQ